MSKNPVLLYKTLVIRVVVLFIGVGIQPAFATVQQKNIEAEYFNVNIEFVGLGKEHTTKLTKGEIDELKVYFKSTLDRLNHTISLEETIEIYRCVILELNKYGLLGDISVKETEELVLSCYQRPIIMKALEKLYNRKQVPLLEKENRNCLIFGCTILTILISPLMFKTLVFLVELFDFLTPFHFPHYGFALLLILTGLLWHVQPFCLGRIICFPDGASGIVTSIGLFGYESWIGILEGKLEYNGVTDVAALGFTGLKIFLPAFGSVYFGYAQHVSIMDYGGPDINFKA